MKILACSSSSGPRAGIMPGDGVVDAAELPTMPASPSTPEP
jgi:hypothetical protein